MPKSAFPTPRKKINPKTGKIMGYEARPYLVINGRKKQVSVYGKTATEVKDQVARLLSKNKAEVKHDSASSTLSLEEYLNRWVERQKSRVEAQTLKYSTYSARKSSLSKYITPYLGHLYLDAVTPALIKTHLDRMLDQLPRRLGQVVGTRSLQLAFETLRLALHDAVEGGHIAVNPCSFSKSLKPLHRRSDKLILNKNQADRLADACKSDAQLRMIILTALQTGMRQGEIFSLRVWNLDFEKNLIQVRATLNKTLGGRSFTKPKSQAAIRDIKVAPEFMADLKEFIGDAYPDSLIFKNKHGGPINKDNFMRRQFNPVVRQAGLPDVDFHSLRHTHASICIALGADPKALARRLGHTSVRLTLDTYGHLFPDHQDGIADGLSKSYSKTDASRQG